MFGFFIRLITTKIKQYGKNGGRGSEQVPRAQPSGVFIFAVLRSRKHSPGIHWLDLYPLTFPSAVSDNHRSKCSRNL
jgi:hypothetical protein